MNPSIFPSCQIGDFLVTALSDGNMAVGLDLLSGIATTDADAIQRKAGIAEPGTLHINGYLIRGRGRVILVDAGTGGLNNAGGQLKEHLVAAGVHPDNVDTLLLTHGHPDHIGGLLDAEGQPVYKNAALYLHWLEAEHWRNNDRLNAANERGQRNFWLARRLLEAYADNLHLIDEDEIIPGIWPVWLPGHTPGHTGFRLDSGVQSLLIWGDIVHFPHIQSVHLAVSIAFDYDPVQAEETRRKILMRVVQENWLVAGMHLGQSGFARIISADEGYRLLYL